MRALALLMNSVRLSHGEEAAEQLLREGRRLFHHEGSNEERADALDMLRNRDSLLAERGEDASILQDAFRDGSSVLCRRCQGLVARARWEAHTTRWCPKLRDASGGEEECGDDGDAMDLD